MYYQLICYDYLYLNIVCLSNIIEVVSETLFHLCCFCLHVVNVECYVFYVVCLSIHV